MWGALSDERTGLPFTITAASRQRSHSWVRVPILLSQIRDSPNMEGQVPIFISPRKRMAQLYPQALGSFLVASYYSHGYGGGFRTSLHSGYYWSQSHSLLYSRGVDSTENTSNAYQWTSTVVAYCCILYPATGYLPRISLRGKLFMELLPSNGCMRHNIFLGLFHFCVFQPQIACNTINASFKMV
jgi:hypothetical protein